MVGNRDVTSGLWSVSRRNCRPSRRNLKCLTALNAASSSLSKVEYLVPAPDSFLDYNASGCQLPPASCCSTPPTCVSEASVARESMAFGAGCANGTAAAQGRVWRSELGAPTVLRSPGQPWPPQRRWRRRAATPASWGPLGVHRSRVEACGQYL